MKMLKSMKSLAAVSILSVALFASCSKDEDNIKLKKGEVVITVTPPSAESVQVISDSTNAAGIVFDGWKANDKLTFYKIESTDQDEKANFTISEGVEFTCVNAKKGKFVGNPSEKSLSVNDLNYATNGYLKVAGASSNLYIFPSIKASSDMRDVVLLCAKKSAEGKYQMEIKGNVLAVTVKEDTPITASFKEGTGYKIGAACLNYDGGEYTSSLEELAFGDSSFDLSANATTFVFFPTAEQGKSFGLCSAGLIVPFNTSDGAIKHGQCFSYTTNYIEGWKIWGAGHLTEVCWGEDYDVTMYYKPQNDTIIYCMLKDAWWRLENDQPVEAVGDYCFYWNTLNNSLYIPAQFTGLLNSKSQPVWYSSAAEFYSGYYSWGVIAGSDEYFRWVEPWLKKNKFIIGKYDGNGYFTLADWIYLANEDGVPTGSGYQFGGDQDYFVADGFKVVI